MTNATHTFANDTAKEVALTSTEDLWDVRLAVSEEDRAIVDAELVERLNGKPDPTVKEPEPEPLDERVKRLAAVTLQDGTELTVHPITGEGLDLTVTGVADLIAMGKELDEKLGQLYALKDAVTRVVAERVDRTGSTTAVLDGLTIKVDASATKVYELEKVRRNFQLLVDQGVVDQSYVDNLLPWSKPPAPKPFVPTQKVDGNKANSAARHADARIRAAIEDGTTWTDKTVRKLESVKPVKN